MNNLLSVCVLDFARPRESMSCLESIKKYVKIPHEVIFCCNGGQYQEYAWEFYKEGLIDKLIINKQNNGGGFGTVQLFNNSFSKYVLWIECDCELVCDIDNLWFNQFRDILESGYASCIDLTGGICGNNIYSGRSFIMNRSFYNSIKKDDNGIYYGPGPYNSGPYLENYIQNYFKNNNLKVVHVKGLIKDNGKWSMREIGDGFYRHSTDEKKLYILRKPTYKTEEYPPLNDTEWQILLEGKWIDGTIPEKWKPHSFTYWKD